MRSCVNVGNVTIDAFNERYQFIDRLGSGGSGHVIRALDQTTQELVAIKLVEVDDDKEVKISCLLDELRPYTDSLLKIYVYGHIEDAPTIVTSFLKHIKWPPRILHFLIGPIYSSEVSFTIEQHVEVIFEILYAVMVLNRSGLEHRDLHAANIVYQKVDYKRQYTINDRIYICENVYIPIIIDFGEAEYISPATEFTDDAYSLAAGMFANISYLKHQFDATLKQQVSKLLTTRQFAILLDPLFDSLHRTIQP